MIRLLILLTVIVGCLSCRKPLNAQRYGQITLIDSTSLDTTLSPTKRNPRLDYGYYPFYYIGPIEDTIRLKVAINSQGYAEKIPERVLRKLDQVTITVDTLIKLTQVEIFHGYLENGRRQLDSIVKSPAYAIVLKNNSDSTLYLGKFNYLRGMLMQYQNELGEWKDAEKAAFTYDACFTGAINILVRPKQILVAKLTRYDGDFSALCRLKLMNFDQICYSNTFHFKLDKSIINQTHF
jgi:hypothetical protein